MNAYVIDGNGNGHLLCGRYRTEDGAIRALLKRVGETEIRFLGATREPREVTAEWLVRYCGNVSEY